MENKLSKYELVIIFILTAIFGVFVERIAYDKEVFSFTRFISLLILTFGVFILLNFISKTKIEVKIKEFVSKVGISKIFIVFTLVIGIISSILVPLYEVPDEFTHFNMIYEEKGIDLEYTDINKGYFGSPDVKKNNTNKVDSKQYFDMSKRIDTGIKIGFPHITAVRHLPQSLGLFIGETFHLPIIVCWTICEIFALLFYLFICDKALKLMPFKKNLMMAIMLLPVCIQQMSSFSYDVVLNGICFLYIASILHLKFTKKRITAFDLLKLLIYLIVIAICKLPYALLGLLLLTLPFKKIELNLFAKTIDYNAIKSRFLKHKYLYIPFFAVFIVFMIYFACGVLMKISIGRVLITSLDNLESTLLLMKRSADIFLNYYFQSIVGNLGIFNIKTPVYCGIIIYFSVLFINFIDFQEKLPKNEEEYKFSKFDMFIIYITAILMIYIIILSMFEWTLYVTGIENYNSLSMAGIKHYLEVLPYIGGVQGRYFIPVLPLLLIPLRSKKISIITNKLSPNFYQFVYFIFIFAYFMILMLTRFWI